MVATIVASKWRIATLLAIVALALAIILPLTVFAVNGDTKVFVTAKDTLTGNTLNVRVTGPGAGGFNGGPNCDIGNTGTVKQRVSGATESFTILATNVAGTVLELYVSANCDTTADVQIDFEPTNVTITTDNNLTNIIYTASIDDVRLQVGVK